MIAFISCKDNFQNTDTITAFATTGAGVRYEDNVSNTGAMDMATVDVPARRPHIFI